MTTPRYILLILSLFMVYTQGMWERMLDNTSAIKMIAEVFIWMYLLLSVKYLKKETPGNIIFFVFLLFSMATSIINGSGLLAWLKYIRYFAYFYLIYITLFHTTISVNQWGLLLRIIVFLVLIQGLGAIYNVIILGQRVEGYVGLMSSLGGTTAATFPLLIISLAVLLYLFNKKQNNKVNLILLLCVLSAALVGYSSEKRAIFFTVPLFLIVIFIFALLHFAKSSAFYKRLGVLVIIILLFLPYYFWGIRKTAGVNYFLTGNETNIELLENALKYATNYEGSLSNEGLTTGRTGSTYQIIIKSTRNVSSFLFGQGYGLIKDESTTSDLGVMYGIVGLTRDIISGGWIVMLLTILIMLKVILTNISIKSNMTKAIRILILFVFLFTYLGYSSDFTVSLKINLIIVFIYVLINSPIHSEYLEYISIHYFGEIEREEDVPQYLINESAS